ncbi:Rho GTPase activation protein, partial [Rozella allomycis CSF55]
RGKGQNYLKNVLSEPLKKVISNHNLDLEIDKSKEITAEIVENITNSIDSIPNGIKWLCKIIREHAKKALYPNITVENENQLIGAFFILRFVNPAIITPQCFFLVNEKPNSQSQRTLILIAKLLQYVTNKPSYSKESYMLPFKQYVDEKNELLFDFFNQLCRVADFESTLHAQKLYSFKEMRVNITINELYELHSMIERHLAEIAKNPSDPLIDLMTKLGSSPPTVPRADSKCISIDIVNKWDTPKDFDNFEEILLQELVKLLTRLLRNDKSSIEDVIANHTILNSNLKMHLDFYLSKDAFKDQVVYFVKMNSKNTNIFIETLEKENQALTQVHETILKHNTYQLYLNNVREQTFQNMLDGEKIFSLCYLNSIGVLINSTIPDTRKSNVLLHIRIIKSGTLDINLSYRGFEHPLSSCQITFDEILLKLNTKENLFLDFITLDVEKLFELIKKTFRINI